MKLEFLEVDPPNERQGAYIGTKAELWRCEDPECDCSQVVVFRAYRNALAGSFRWHVRIAEGPFRTDGEHWHNNEVETEMAEARIVAASDERSNGTHIWIPIVSGETTGDRT